MVSYRWYFQKGYNLSQDNTMRTTEHRRLDCTFIESIRILIAKAMMNLSVLFLGIQLRGNLVTGNWNQSKIGYR